MSAIFAIVVLRYFSEYWLFAVFVIGSAAFGAFYGGLGGALSESFFTLIAGGVAIIWGCASRAAWRVE